MPSNTFYQGGKAAACCTACPPSSTRFHQPHRTTTVRNGQPACCIQEQVAMATENTCYAECLLPSRHHAHCRRNSQPARWPARLSTDVIPRSCSAAYTGEESCVNPHPNPCVMFFSMLTPPLPLFLLPPPISPLPQLLGKKSQNNNKQASWFLLFLVVLLLLFPISLLWDEVPACILHSG